MGICHVSHRALGLQELALVLLCGAQDGVQADVPVLQGTGTGEGGSESLPWHVRVHPPPHTELTEVVK